MIHFIELDDTVSTWGEKVRLRMSPSSHGM